MRGGIPFLEASSSYRKFNDPEVECLKFRQAVSSESRQRDACFEVGEQMAPSNGGQVICGREPDKWRHCRGDGYKFIHAQLFVLWCREGSKRVNKRLHDSRINLPQTISASFQLSPSSRETFHMQTKAFPYWAGCHFTSPLDGNRWYMNIGN